MTDQEVYTRGLRGEKPKKGVDMERYRNLGGDSGVLSYEIGDGCITVQFRDGSLYLYNCESAGVGSIERMMELALAGQGLNSFISKVVKKGYASKLR